MIVNHLDNFDTRQGNTVRRHIALTFDDGPDPRHTPLLLDVLAEHKVGATFFVLGQAAAQYPRLIERMISAGHTVGNHSYSHRHPWLMSAERARYEVTAATSIISHISGQPPRWFRPPHGRLRNAMVQQARAENMTTVLWSYSVIDWGPLGTDNGIAQRLERVQRGDIVLMHDGARQHNRPALTTKHLPVLMDLLAQHNISPVTLDQAV